MQFSKTIQKRWPFNIGQVWLLISVIYTVTRNPGLHILNFDWYYIYSIQSTEGPPPKTAPVRPIASPVARTHATPSQSQANMKATASIKPMPSPLSVAISTPTATVMPTTVTHQEHQEEGAPAAQISPVTTTTRPTQQVQRVIPQQDLSGNIVLYYFSVCKLVFSINVNKAKILLTLIYLNNSQSISGNFFCIFVAEDFISNCLFYSLLIGEGSL